MTGKAPVSEGTWQEKRHRDKTVLKQLVQENGETSVPPGQLWEGSLGRKLQYLVWNELEAWLGRTSKWTCAPGVCK